MSRGRARNEAPSASSPGSPSSRSPSSKTPTRTPPYRRSKRSRALGLSVNIELAADPVSMMSV